MEPGICDVAIMHILAIFQQKSGVMKQFWPIINSVPAATETL